MSTLKKYNNVIHMPGVDDRTKGVNNPKTRVDEDQDETNVSLIDYSDFIRLILEPTPDDASEELSIARNEISLARNELGIPFFEQSSVKESGENMDGGYQKLIDRLDQDIRDHKKEVRERDKQLHEDMKEREERMLKQISDLIGAQNQVIEHKLSSIEQKMDHISSDVDHTRSEMANITNRIDSLHGRVDSSRYFIIGSVIAILIGIAGIVYANWQVIASMLQLSNK